MSKETPQASGAGSDQSSGAPVETGSESSTETRSTVRAEDHERALKDVHKFKNRVRELEDTIKARDTQALREKEDYKGLWEKEKTEKEELLTKHQSLRDWVFADKRISAVKTEAIKHGLRPEAEKDLELYPMDEVVVEPTPSGRFSVIGAEAFVEKMKKTRPFLFRPDGPPVVNPGGNLRPDQGTEVTGTDLYEIEKKHGRGSKEWKNAFEKFRAARAKK